MFSEKPRKFLKSLTDKMNGGNRVRNKLASYVRYSL